MHIHTFCDEITIKDIIKVNEKNEKGEFVVKEKQKFARS